MKPAPGLYQRLLGPAWQSLHNQVRRLHLADSVGRLEASGKFCITQGRNPFARLIAWLLRMPRASDGASVRLVIKRRGPQELWSKTFESIRLQTVQRLDDHGFLVERFDLFEICFRILVEGEGLRYQQEAFRVIIGKIGIPVPRRMAPKVSALEMPSKASNQTAVDVEVSAPLVGLILKYRGEIRVQG